MDLAPNALIDPKLFVRFWSRVSFGADCWEWPPTVTGYGQIWWQGKNLQAHRLAYEWLVGPIPAGLTIDHLCRNPRCVNPAHLEAVTRGENVLRGMSLPAQNARATHCPRNHPYDAANTYIVPSTGYRQCRACYPEAQKRMQLRRGWRRS